MQADIASAAHVLSRHLTHPDISAIYRQLTACLDTSEAPKTEESSSAQTSPFTTTGLAMLLISLMINSITQQATHDWPAALGVTGYHFQLAGGRWQHLMACRHAEASWQKLTFHSSTESELCALDEAAREMISPNKLLVDFGILVSTRAGRHRPRQHGSDHTD